MRDHTVQPTNREPRSNTVIVVEPDVLARYVLSDYLRDCGYRVVECANAEDVLIVLSAGRKVDVVLSEVRLQGRLDGFGLARRIREAHPKVDVVLASSPANAAGKAGELCDEGRFGKPYLPRDVIRRINRLREGGRRPRS